MTTNWYNIKIDFNLSKNLTDDELFDLNEDIQKLIDKHNPIIIEGDVRPSDKGFNRKELKKRLSSMQSKQYKLSCYLSKLIADIEKAYK